MGNNIELAKYYLSAASKFKKIIIIIFSGGGYDIYAGLPLYYALKDRYNVFLANYSFTECK